jgi:preprotein translocase subunit YajC
MNTLFLSLFIAGLLFGLIFLIFKLIISDSKQKEYQNKMKVGDKVYVPIDRTSVDGIITKIEGDNVEVSVNFKKWRVYPNGHV